MENRDGFHRGLPALCGLALATFAGANPAAASSPPDTFRVYLANAPITPPTPRTIIGLVNDQICRRPWDVEVADKVAIDDLRAKSRAMGANALTDVRLDRHRTNLKSSCWTSVRVSGTAVILPMREMEARRGSEIVGASSGESSSATKD